MLMFKIFRDSLFDPKKILNYQNRSLGFAFLYLFILSIFISAAGIVYYVSYDNTVISTETTGCTYDTTNGFVCDRTISDIYIFNDTAQVNQLNETYDIYGYQFYFLNEDETVNDIYNMTSGVSFVGQGHDFVVYDGTTAVASVPLTTLDNYVTSFDELMSYMKSNLIVASVLMNIIINFIIIIFFTLISTITFSLFKKSLGYKKVFTLSAFAITPTAAVLAFNDLIGFGDVIFVLLLIASYYSISILRRQLFMMYNYNQGTVFRTPESPKQEDSKEDSSEVEENQDNQNNDEDEENK